MYNQVQFANTYRPNSGKVRSTAEQKQLPMTMLLIGLASMAEKKRISQISNRIVMQITIFGKFIYLQGIQIEAHSRP